MELTAETRLNRALDLHPDVLEYVTLLNPHDFERLRNPLMRWLMPPRELGEQQRRRPRLGQWGGQMSTSFVSNDQS